MAERHYLITGAASGIGAAACRALAAPGAAIAVHTRKNREGAERVAAEVRARGGEAQVLLADLAEPEAPARLVGQATEALGGLDVLVSNAGFADRTPVAALTDAGFAASHDAITFALLRLARAAQPHLARGRAPRLVAVSSFVAHVFRLEHPVFPASAAAKAALEALVKALAIEWAPGITVNAVVPGFTRKDPGAHAALDPRAFDERIARIPLRRLGTPDEVAAAIAFLASPAGGYITGQCLHVDGGITV
ncbi:short-chain dehydrogenase [Siccirubricoccus deserti]|uniref:SDR family oxidoreductase n=1 Tax=Siccirubricoccus deserti TaxID=2013562 RepID=A0A9X0QZ34_9PROT|nr:SDR family oxidoreductase [Siccirubricoccus deserti]MBC4015712.1 SDR family oxidoreductase [Siccirubricoccus deserti]GGC44022.1 short-chain dehydrogenase [Siccirubricoccus deserti]